MVYTYTKFTNDDVEKDLIMGKVSPFTFFSKTKTKTDVLSSVTDLPWSG